LGSFLETFAAGPVEPFFALLFLEAALVFTALAAGFDFDSFAAGLEALAADFGLAEVLETGLTVFTDFAEAAFLTTAVLDLDALLAPATRVAFFGAAGAFATWSSHRKAFPGITKTHVKSDKSV
jgi:hypothetical protein